MSDWIILGWAFFGFIVVCTVWGAFVVRRLERDRDAAHRHFMRNLNEQSERSRKAHEELQARLKRRD